MWALKTLPLHSPFQPLKTRKTISICILKKCKGVTDHLHGPAPQQGILKKATLSPSCTADSTAAQQGHPKWHKCRAHLCSCNAKRSHPGAKSTSLNINSQGYKLSLSPTSTASSWWFLPFKPRLRWCCSMTGVCTSHEPTPVVPFATSRFQHHFVHPPHPWCSKERALLLLCNKWEFPPLQPRLSATAVNPSWLLTSCSWFHTTLIRNILRNPTVQNNIAFSENT